MAEENTQIDPAVMQLGKAQYNLCMGCHGPDGNGMPNVGPPLAGSEWVLGPAENLIKIQLRGLMGPIKVKGKDYNLGMAPMGVGQSDENVAAVLTYVRNSWGNSASAVDPANVKALRAEHQGKAMLTVADLIDPMEAAKAEATTEAPKPLPPIPTLAMRQQLGASTAGIVAAAVIGTLTVIGLLKMKFTGGK